MSKRTVNIRKHVQLMSPREGRVLLVQARGQNAKSRPIVEHQETSSSPLYVLPDTRYK